MYYYVQFLLPCYLRFSVHSMSCADFKGIALPHELENAGAIEGEMGNAHLFCRRILCISIFAVCVCACVSLYLSVLACHTVQG